MLLSGAPPAARQQLGVLRHLGSIGFSVASPALLPFYSVGGTAFGPAIAIALMYAGRDSMRCT